MEKPLIGTYVKLVKKDGFTLYGSIIDSNDYGVYLKTPQKTSYISFEFIGEIRPHTEDGR